MNVTPRCPHCHAPLLELPQGGDYCDRCEPSAPYTGEPDTFALTVQLDPLEAYAEQSQEDDA
jgi:hypothetical protein